MKKHEKIIFATAGGLFLYLLVNDKKFRKTIIGALEYWAKEHAKDVEEKSEPATTNTVSTAGKT